MPEAAKAVLVVDDDWLDADELRLFIKENGIINVPIAMSGGVISLARDYFSVAFIVMPERIRQDPAHPLCRATLRQFPSTPIISLHKQVRRELLLSDSCKEFGIRDRHNDCQ